MPLPKRGKKESTKEFMSRCMSDDKVRQEFPDQSQRAAVCMSRAGENLTIIEAVDLQITQKPETNSCHNKK